MKEEVFVILTAPWTTPADLQGREFLESHGCIFDDFPAQCKTRITFPAGTIRKWEVRLGFAERFNLTLPDDLTLNLTYNTQARQSYLSFTDPPHMPIDAERSSIS